MNNLFFILLFSCCNVFAGTTPTKLYLLSNVLPSQIQPNTQIHLTAKPKDGSNIDYQFEEIKDGVTTLLQFYNPNTEINYNVPANFKEITIKLTAHGFADTDISTSFKITNNAPFTFSKNKAYQLEELTIEHPGISWGTKHETTLVGSDGATYQAIGFPTSDGEFALTIPRVALNKDTQTTKFEIKISGVNTYRRQFIEVYNAPAISVSNRSFKRGELFILNLLEEITLTDQVYTGTVDSQTARLAKVDSKSLALDTYDLQVGQHELSFSISGFNFKFYFEVIEGEVIADPKTYLDNKIDSIETGIGSISVDLPPEALPTLQQAITNFKTVLPSLTMETSNRLACFFENNFNISISEKKKKTLLISPEQDLLKLRDRTTQILDKARLVFASASLLNSGLLFISDTWNPGYVIFSEAAGIIGAAGITAYFQPLSNEIKLLHSTSGWIKDTQVIDEIEISNGSTFKSGATQKFEVSAQYNNINKNDGTNSNGRVSELYLSLKYVKDNYVNVFGLPVSLSYLLKSKTIFDITQIEPSTKVTAPDLKNYKVGAVRIGELGTTKIWKVGDAKVEKGDFRFAVKFKTNLKQSSEFNFELIYDFHDFGIFDDISLIDAVIDPAGGCGGADGEFHDNPREVPGPYAGAVGGFVADTAKISSSITSYPNTEVCGKSVINGGKYTTIAGKFNNVNINVEEGSMSGNWDGVRVQIKQGNISGTIVNSSFIGESIWASNFVSGAAITGKYVNIKNSTVKADITHNAGSCVAITDEHIAKEVYIERAAINAPVNGCGIRMTKSTFLPGALNVINAAITGYDIWIRGATINAELSGHRIWVREATLNSSVGSCTSVFGEHPHETFPDCVKKKNFVELR